MKSRIHAAAALVATLCILSFWLSTVISELFLSQAAVAAVKQAIVYGMAILVPAMAITGGTGFSLAKLRRGNLVARKQKRMPIIAANGLLILLPAAFFLAHRAGQGNFDGLFYAIQGVELLAGSINLSLMALNLRDGLRLAGRNRRVPVPG